MTNTTRRYTDAEKQSLTESALDLIAQGYSRTKAAATLGLGKTTLYDWLAARQTEAAQAQRTAMELLLDETENDTYSRLEAYISCRDEVWVAFVSRRETADASALRMLAVVDKLERMIDRLTGGLYYLHRPGTKKATTAPENSGTFPAEVPAATPSPLADEPQAIENQQFVETELAELLPPVSGTFPAALPNIPAAVPVRQQPPRKQGAPIPPGWGRKRSKR